ncbi:MAG: ATP-binding protein [Rhodospirillaceae bacterium]|nr:ATP-binding protein [Rhodospirillales bacterium]
MANQKTNGPAKPTSPASSGPAGSEFEAQVGASYLLSMLVGGEPLGLPGTVVDSIEFQRASEGHPLDDVIVHSHDLLGNAVTLEVQVKRSIGFSPSDDVFKSVVAQIVEAARKPGFWESKHELAVATARTSRKIDGAYQDVLTWARHVGSAETFAARIARKGAASDDMRTFVNTFRSHLMAEGFSHDDEMVWKLLRRFQILIFDFTAMGSASEALARERSARALDSSEANRAGDLWSALVGVALHFAARGGDLTREVLRNEATLNTFRWAGEPRHLRALAALAENGAAALDDIRDQINGVSISRPARMAEVHANLEQGRYVDIRGDAGVGKSGILKHFALQAAAASRIIVLKPGRTTPRGWTAFRTALGFDGSARELLVELSASGTGLLFIDNLDLFTVEEQTTVNDLLRAVATVPGFSVIATARRDSGGDESVWLAQDALDQLGRAQPVMIGELGDTEVEELIAAAPGVASLLSSAHPARDVTRNLYRLARLVMRPADAPILRTEVNMADEWWNTADGSSEGRRERQRILRHLAEQALGAVATFDVSSQPPGPVDDLITSETLRDYGNDRVGFRHDVLREWAIAKLIGLGGDTLQRLPFDKPAPAFLARSVELYARSLIEGVHDDRAWSALLDRLTGADTHGSWRRAVLLALVRSEAAPQALVTAMPRLFAAGGTVLNELIRTTMAVDVQPGREMFVGSGIDVELLPGSFTVPSGPSWFRLIAWLLALGDELPGGCVPDVVNLFNAWSQAFLGLDPVTPRLLACFHHWLTEIESAREARYSRDFPPYFGDALTSGQIRSLEDDIRHGFALFANRVPELAAEYLRTAKNRKDHEQIAAALHEFRGTLAAAAPNELADLFKSALIPAPGSDDQPSHRRSSYFDSVFTHFDAKFLPVSPAQGPFFDLLKARPETGKRLIKRLIDYAISQTCKSQEEPDAIEIVTSDGVKRFPWLFTFMWSREAGATYYAITSGLMALEGWAHARIEAGETVEAVIVDVLGPGDAPAAYLLVAIDLILSHWPASREAAIPFVSNPNLIVMDRERQTRESVEFPDIFGLNSLQREPTGAISAKSLADRPSRKISLYDLLAHYTFAEDPAQRDRLVTLLRRAAESLDAPTAESNFGDPEFMVIHALNQLDPGNWRPVEVRFKDGSTGQRQEYVAPQSEADHLAPFQTEAQERLLETQVQVAAAKILEEPSRGSLQAASALVEWAMARALPTANVYEEDRELATWAVAEAVMNIAMIAMRDGDSELRQKSREWAHGIFEQRLAQPIDRAAGSLSQLRFNPLAVAFAGLAFSLRDRAEEGDIRKLLEIAVHPSTAASRGFAVSVSAIAEVDERLLKAVLRCALKARVFCHRNWELEEDVYEARKAELRREVDVAIDHEIDWIAGRGPEPAWPTFPPCNPLPRRGIRLGGEPAQMHERRRSPRPEEHADSGGAADWLEALRDVADVSQHPWLRDLIEHYRAWTYDANGGSLEAKEEVDRPPTEWNDAYFGLMAVCLPGLSIAEVDAFAIGLICDFKSPNVFLSVSARFLRSLDVIYLDTDNIDPVVAAHVRQRIAEALRRQYAWDRFARNRSDSMERNIGDTVSAFFFHVYNGGFTPPRCYLPPSRVFKSLPLLPTLQALAIEAPSLLIAVETMNMLEVAPGVGQLSFAIAAAKAWACQRQDDPVFWVDHAIGRRFCQYLKRLRVIEPACVLSDSPLRGDIDQILAALVRSGVPEAGRFETSLSGL